MATYPWVLPFLHQPLYVHTTLKPYESTWVCDHPLGAAVGPSPTLALVPVCHSPTSCARVPVTRLHRPRALQEAASPHLGPDVQLKLEIQGGHSSSGPGLFPLDEAAGLVAMHGDVMGWAVSFCNENPGHTPEPQGCLWAAEGEARFIPPGSEEQLPAEGGVVGLEARDRLR